MGEKVIYIRGDFPFLPEGPVSDALIRDAKALLAVDEGVLTSIRDHLEAFPGFLDRDSIEDVVASHVDNSEVCEALVRWVANVDGLCRETGQSVENVLSRLLSQVDEWLKDEANLEKGLLSREDFEQLKARLPLIIKRYPGLDRQAKAQRLARATGLRLEKLEIICDLRPVFDKNREQLEGMIPCTILKVVCIGVDGLPVALEAILSQQDVAQLAEAATNAQKKLAKLRQFLQETKLSVTGIEGTMERDER